MVEMLSPALMPKIRAFQWTWSRKQLVVIPAGNLLFQVERCLSEIKNNSRFPSGMTTSG